MRCFLPAGSDVVIRRGDSDASWYETKKEVDVTGYSVGFCPLRANLKVLVAVVDGISIFFLESQVEVELTEETKLSVQGVQLYLLQYDIPVVVSTHANRYPDEDGRSFQHPSKWMWGIGSRTSGSVWLVPKQLFPWRRIRSLIRAGCTYNKTVVDSSDAYNQLQKAAIACRNAWVEAEQSYNECVASALTRFNARAQEEDCDEEENQKQYDRDLNRVEKDRDKKQAGILSGARLYAIPEEFVRSGRTNLKAINSDGSVNMNSSTRGTAVASVNLLERQVEAHCNAVDTLRKAGAEAKGIGDAVENGSLPHDIAADYAEDNEILPEEDTYSLRDLFKD
jgi:hypothetical protein